MKCALGADGSLRCENIFSGILKKGLDEHEELRYNRPNIPKQGCEGKSKRMDAVQRAPVGGKGYG